jgi:hypothetical protein
MAIVAHDLTLTDPAPARGPAANIGTKNLAFMASEAHFTSAAIDPMLILERARSALEIDILRVAQS